jgi:hypothetical protein
MEILDLITDAVDEYDNAYNRPALPKWVTIDQFADWLDKSDKLSHVDVYSLLSKTLGFIPLYGTPQIHKGLCIVATDPQCGE